MNNAQHSTAAPYAAVIDSILQKYLDLPGALLPILHATQNALGFVPTEAVPQIASALNQTPADVHGVISFYHHFKTAPPGNHQIEICRAEACQARGSRSLEQHVKQSLGIDYHATTADGEISLEPVYCLGNCACGPSLRVGDEVHGRMDAAKFDELYEALTTVPVEVR